MDGEVGEKLLAKYIAGECSEQEEARVREWIAQDTDAANRVARLLRIWEATDVSLSHWDAESAWKKLRRRVQSEDAASTPGLGNRLQAGSRLQDRLAKRSRPKRPHRRTAHSSRGQILRMAAVGAIVVALTLVATLLIESPSLGVMETEAKVFVAKKGEQTTVRLTDGTQVRLNADSRLTIPMGFEDDRREVRLEGEAYFDVAKDTERPFIVHAKDAAVEVLGTAFGVESYADEEETQVAVAEGEVALRTRQPAGRDTVAVLRSRYLATASDKGLQAVHEDVDISRKLAWLEGKLVFEDAPFEEVVRKLERRYDIRVEVEMPAHNVVGLNATFEDVPLDEVLHDITAALNLKYRRDRSSVTFYL